MEKNTDVNKIIKEVVYHLNNIGLMEKKHGKYYTWNNLGYLHTFQTFVNGRAQGLSIRFEHTFKMKKLDLEQRSITKYLTYNPIRDVQYYNNGCCSIITKKEFIEILCAYADEYPELSKNGMLNIIIQLKKTIGKKYHLFDNVFKIFFGSHIFKELKN
jgi:hypothetical protein